MDRREKSKYLAEHLEVEHEKELSTGWNPTDLLRLQMDHFHLHSTRDDWTHSHEPGKMHEVWNA